MWAVKGFSRWQLVVWIWLVVIATGTPGAAQDAPSADPSASPREKELRDQLRNILHELDEIQQQKEKTTPEEERPSIIKEEAHEGTGEEQPVEVPHYDLADMSIVSKRLQ